MSSKAEPGAPSDKKKYETVRRNVFKDIGVPNAEEHWVKAQLVFKIDTIMKDRGLKQVGAPGYLKLFRRSGPLRWEAPF